MATILVVDDERMICDLLRAVLSRHGHEVFTACSGREGVELFRQRRPRVTLLDLRMPDLDGISVLKQIREVDPQAAVMILTASPPDTLEQQARELGVTDFLVKGSLSLDALVGSVGRVTQQSVDLTEPPTLLTDALANTEHGIFIIVVDDEPQIRDLLTQFLTLRGYRVWAAQNGSEALELVMQEQPHLMILDIYMPGMNGVEVLRELRTTKTYTGGVIMLTGSQDQALLQEAWKLGSLNVLGKPVELARLALAIHTALAFQGIDPVHRVRR